MDVTWTRQLPSEDARVFDAFVLEAPSGHHAQTLAWAELARSVAYVSPRFVLVRDQGRPVGAALLLRASVVGLTLPAAWIERGPVVARVADVGAVALAIARIARARGIAHLRVMPYWAGANAALAEESLRQAGFRVAQRPDGAHVRTLRLALAGRRAEDLFSGQSLQKVRWRIHQAQRAGGHARPAIDADWLALRKMHDTTMESQGMRVRPRTWWDALRSHLSDARRGAMHACMFEGRVVAASVVLRHGPVATYAWGASLPEKMRLPFSKAIPSLAAGIRWAHAVGCNTFDLGGIPEEGDLDPKRRSIATFKLDFDKERIPLVREHARWLF
jgi:hypothetical protein